MKAIVYEQYGSPDVLELKEVEKPTPKDNQVLIKVYAASINSWDLDLLTGTPYLYRLGAFRKPRYKILGADIAGRIEAIGIDIKQFQPGDEVIGDISGCGWGGFAEYVCVTEHALALKSSRMTFVEAAAVPQAAVLALQGLRYKGELQKGHKVLINGAGGGVGTFAVQIAKSLGAEVTGVDILSKLDMLRSIGADHVMDHTQENFTQKGQQYDLILDVIAHRSIFDYKRTLSPLGRFVMVGGSISRIFQLLFLGPWFSKTKTKRMGILIHKPNKNDLTVINELFESGKVVPIIDSCYPLSKTADAFRHYAEGKAKGKVMITMEENNNS